MRIEQTMTARAHCCSTTSRVLGIGGLVLAIACGGSADETNSNAIVIGAALPFTGEEATIGQNLEQAMLLAVEDVNRAGGVAGRKLRLASRDSNSGSERGLNALLDLLYIEGVSYLVGPEEDELSVEIVPDIKGLDVFNVLPGFASPHIERVTHEGAWLRLPPQHYTFGCGLAELARERGLETANFVVAHDGFNQSVASEFSAEFDGVGGQLLPSTTVRAEDPSYLARVVAALDLDPDRTLLIVNPATAARIVTELFVNGREGNWLLGPTLHTPGFLQNLPFGSLDGATGISPTLSLTSECEEQSASYRGPVGCRRDNEEAFSDHYARRWSGDRPFPAAHFYYDAVILLAMGLSHAAWEGESEPRAEELHDALLEMHREGTDRGRWDELDVVLATLADGTPLAYTGAAAEYVFDRYGAAMHSVFDVWSIGRQAYVDEGQIQPKCVRTWNKSVLWEADEAPAVGRGSR
ncbi:MAG: ABC transporter substrate-binding protein [Polyangiaceae bacterium]|nr:ABC transporter substrate-binding protein [Polyangiaceae bacterium]